MGAFSSDWLTLREASDAAARSSRLVSLLGEVLPHDLVHALDLGTGTGANVRYLTDRLPVRQDWLQVDDDARLVEEASRMEGSGVVRRVDLAAEINSMELGILDGRDLVTASALLDLVSEPWLRTLAAKCRRAGAAVLFALTYDGEIRCQPEEPEDQAIRDLVNRHQRNDKGFGPALGPTAADVAERCFADLGYHVERERSPWLLISDTEPRVTDVVGAGPSLQRQLIEGWAEAASEVAPGQLTSIRRWRERRLAHVTAKRSRLTVGHVDIAAWLPRNESTTTM
jgi:hypothetical protein